MDSKNIKIFVAPACKNRKLLKINFDNNFDNIDFRNYSCDFYYDWERNDHHWKTDCAIVFFKRICNYLNISPNTNYIIEKHRVSKNKNITHKSVYIPGNYSTYCIQDNIRRNGDYNILKFSSDGITIKNMIRYNNTYTDYHKTFYGSHKISVTKNNDPILKNSKRIIMIGDSMVIPIAPLFCGITKEFIYIDDRIQNNYKIDNLTENDDIILSLGIQENYNMHINKIHKFINI